MNLKAAIHETDTRSGRHAAKKPLKKDGCRTETVPDNMPDVDSICRCIHCLEKDVSRHRKMLNRLLHPHGYPGAQSAAARALPDAEPDRMPDYISDCRHGYRARYRNMLLDTIQELEATRKAFKSKRLAALRRRLMAELKRID